MRNSNADWTVLAGFFFRLLTQPYDNFSDHVALGTKFTETCFVLGDFLFDDVALGTKFIEMLFALSNPLSDDTGEIVEDFPEARGCSFGNSCQTGPHTFVADIGRYLPLRGGY